MVDKKNIAKRAYIYFVKETKKKRGLIEFMQLRNAILMTLFHLNRVLVVMVNHSNFEFPFNKFKSKEKKSINMSYIFTTSNAMRVLVCGNPRCDNIVAQFGHCVYYDSE